MIVGDAGSGKSEAAIKYKLDHPDAILAIANPTTSSKGAILLLITKSLHGICRYDATNAVFMERIIERLAGSARILIIDESHFLDWPALECIRRIHDGARIGVALLGQPALYGQMKGGRTAHLYDQIYSRIGVRCHLKGDVTREDVSMLASSICFEGIDRKALDFLYFKACGPGKFRVMCKLLKAACRVAREEKTKVTLELLRDVNGLLML
jgi:DNA transposition AAA+ family ATPase